MTRVLVVAALGVFVLGAGAFALYHAAASREPQVRQVPIKVLSAREIIGRSGVLVEVRPTDEITCRCAFLADARSACFCKDER
jgi:hypothetical protein